MARLIDVLPGRTRSIDQHPEGTLSIAVSIAHPTVLLTFLFTQLEMNEQLDVVQLLKRAPEKFERHLPSVGEDDLLRVEQDLGVRFPESYRQFLMYSDGGEFIDYRLYLFNLYEFESFNPHAVWSSGLPGMIFFGNDCGNGVFYFDPENYLGRGYWAIYSVGMGSCSFAYSRYEASSFSHLIQRALNGEDLREGPWLKDDGTLPRPD